ncbi:MAG: helix-turn-helix domain-containing protein [Alphaproteobacteria bacterium]|nr:helix-turn-helix domain-containing protein [Alphaproteobacteria bacterium]
MSKRRHRSELNLANCPVEAALNVIGGKWKSVILFRLSEGTLRFNEMHRLLPNTTQRMLTNQLRELERDGMINRKVYAQVPPKVEYSLTELGWTLEPLLANLWDWGKTQILPRMPEEKNTTEEAIKEPV